MSNTQPRVSIGLPVYNGENFLKEALDSILAQTFEDFELIISDNASIDRTEEICQTYAAKDSRIRYYRNAQNIGAAGNYNRVFELSRGEYFKWAAHDDMCAPEFLERCVEVLDREPSIALCYPKANNVDEQGKYLQIYTENLNYRSSKPHQRFYEILTVYGWYLATPAFGLMRSSLLKKTVLIENYPHSDRVMLANLALYGEFYEVPEYLFYRRLHSQISTHANSTSESLAIWFDPKNRGKVLLPRLNRYFAYVRVVQRSQLDWNEKLRCYLQIMRRFFMYEWLLKILGEMREDLKQVAQPSGKESTQK